MASASQNVNLESLRSRGVQESRHDKLSTIYSGTIQSSHGVTFLLQNTADSSLILTGLGLNVETAGEEVPCRVQIHTRPTGGEYALALDTSSATCVGPGEETVVTDEMFLRYYEQTGNREFLEINDGERDLQDARYPLVIEPGSSMEVYVVVLPAEGDVDTSGIQPILLSSKG